MRTTLLLGAGFIGIAGWWLYRRVTWRVEVPMSEQRQALFMSAGEKYRRTHEANPWMLRHRRVWRKSA